MRRIIDDLNAQLSPRATGLTEGRDPFVALMTTLRGLRARGKEVEGELEAVAQALRSIKFYMEARWADEPQVSGVGAALDQAINELQNLAEYAESSRD